MEKTSKLPFNMVFNYILPIHLLPKPEQVKMHNHQGLQLLFPTTTFLPIKQTFSGIKFPSNILFLGAPPSHPPS